ncbi:hypothetical protein D3C71_1478040 [compost metagenome]
MIVDAPHHAGLPVSLILPYIGKQQIFLAAVMPVDLRYKGQIVKQLLDVGGGVLLQEFTGMQLQLEIDKPLDIAVLPFEGMHRMSRQLFGT